MAAIHHRMAHVCLLVKDVHKAAADYQKILSVIDPKQLEKKMVFHENFGVGNEREHVITFPSVGDCCEIQLMQPLTPGTALYERLQKRGEGLHHVCFTSSDVDDIKKQLDAKGIQSTPVVSDPAGIPHQRWNFIPSGPAHGIYIELANWYEAIDGAWYPPR